MPSAIEIRTRYLITAAEEAKVTASTNLGAANAATDNAYSAIVAAVRAAGHDSFEIGATVVTVPPRIRGWSAANGVSSANGISSAGRVSIGLDALVTAFNAANVVSTRRQHEHDGLVYLLSSAQGILLQDADYAAATTAEDFNALLSMLASIQASMAE